MVQHELLMVVAAPLIAVSAPLIALLWATPSGSSVRAHSARFDAADQVAWAALTAPLSVFRTACRSPMDMASAGALRLRAYP